MKKLFEAVIIAIFTIAFTACVKEEPYLEVSVSSISTGQIGGEYSLSINSNNAWTASANSNWCILSASSGEGSETASTIKVTVSPNTSYDSRTCIINVRSGNLSANVEVSQGAKEGIMLETYQFKLTSAAQSLVIPVSTNATLSVVIPDDCKSWISYQDTKALTSTSVTLSIAKNEGYDDRTATVALRGESGIEEPVVITQSSMDAFILSEHTYDLSFDEQDVEVQFKTTVSDYEIAVSEAASSWISVLNSSATKALRDESVIFHISENQSGDEGREGMVTIKNKSGDVSETVVFSQRSAEILKPEWEHLVITGEEQMFKIPFSYNLDYSYSVVTGSSWIQPLDTKSVSTTELPFMAKVNTSGSPREGCIRFTSKDGKRSTDITITQANLGEGILTLVTEGSSEPKFTFNSTDVLWQFYWEDGTKSKVGEMMWPSYGASGTHTTKLVMSKTGNFTIQLTGVKVLDLREL